MRRLALVGVLVTAIAVAASPYSAASARADGDAPEGLVWLALGDSYASGEGLRYVDYTANPSDRNCEIATGLATVNDGNGSRSYAKVAYDEVRADWVDSYFELLACTGAVSNQVHDQYREEWLALDGRKADLVTMSIGGNNIGFADVIFGRAGITFEQGFNVAAGFFTGGVSSGLTEAARWAVDPSIGCTVREDELRNRIDQLVADEGSGPFGTQALPQMYRELEENLMNEGGHIIVTGYPNLVGESGNWPLWLFEGNRCSRIRRADTAMLRSAAGYLNEQLALMVDRLNASSDSHVHYHWVDVSQVYENDETGNHGLCTGDLWVNGMTVGIAGPDEGLIPFRIQRSFHPTQNGQDATGHAVAEVVRGLDWPDQSRDDTAPTYEQLQTADIPALCGHEPATLVGGIDANANPGFFELMPEFSDGGQSWASFDSAEGPLSAVAAGCNAGGVGWPNPILFFGPGPTFYDDAMVFEDYDWESIGLFAPGRSAVDAIQVDGQRLIVDVGMYTPSEGGCCYSGHATIALAARNGEMVVDEVLAYSSGGAQDLCYPDNPGGWLETERFNVAICLRIDGDRYVGGSRESGDRIELDACAVDDYLWLATNEGYRYKVDLWVDGIPGLRVYDPSGALILDEQARTVDGEMRYGYVYGAREYCP